MKSVILEIRALGGLIFKPDVVAKIHIRPALAGTEKHVAVGFSLSLDGTSTGVVMFEDRISALTICSNFNRSRKRKFKNHSNEPPSKVKATKLVESLPNLKENECSGDLNAVTLEQIAVYHLSQEILHVFFVPYSSEPDEKVEAFVHYRKKWLSVNIPMSSIDMYVSEYCACPCCTGDQDQLLIDWPEGDCSLDGDLMTDDPNLDLDLDLERLAIQ